MPAFTLQIFQSELDKIQRYVLAYPNIETGGDLFGLWSNSGDPVVQLLIGPGKNCRRTSVSFHQDIGYLQDVGTFLNTSLMLCHIGSWHSHHQLSLTQPSAGDRSTLCNNFPPGLQRYIMIIANIVTSSTSTSAKSVHIHPYMFTSKGHVCQTGTVQRISRTSPYMGYGYVMNKLNEGAERSRGTSKSEYDSQREVKSSKRDRRSPTKAEAPSLHKTSENIRPTTAGQRNGYPEKSTVHQWYNSSEGKAKLQKIVENIRGKLKPTDDVDFSRNTNSLNLTLKFTHNGNTWLIEFPASFDKEPARIQCNSRQPLFSTNIVEAIQKRCKCSPCIHEIIGHGNTKPQPTDHRVSMSNHDAGKSKRSPRPSARSKSVGPQRERPRSAKVPWYKTEEGKSTLKTLQNDIESFERNAKVKLNTNDFSQEVSLTFQHGYYEWILTFPRNYPKGRAKISNKVAGVTKLLGSLPEELNVLETVKQTCICSRCRARIKSSQRKTPSARYPPSRHFPIEADDRNPVINQVKASPEDNRQWYLIDTGEKALSRICTQISSLLLDGSSVDISRAKTSGDIRLEFDYHHCRWRIEFPTNYPTKQPEIGYYDRFEHYTSINFKSPGIIWLAIKDNCSCRLCKRYTTTRLR